MSTRAQLVEYINANIVQNSTQSITGLKLNEILIDFTNSFLVPDTDFPLLPSKGGTGIANSDYNIISLGGDITTGGHVIVGSTLTTIGAFVTGGAFNTANAFRTNGNFTLDLTVTNTTNATLPAGTVTIPALSTNNTWTGTNGFGNGLTVSAGNVGITLGNLTVAAGNLDVTSGTLNVGGATTVAGLTTGATTHNANVTMADARNIVVGTGTGTVIGTTTGQKLAFFGGTPKSRQTNAISAAAFTANSSGIIDDSAVWGGYSVGQIVAILQTYGLIA